MGLDIFLGIIVLLAALRGWFRGFWSQGIRLAGLVACVYLAEPVRDAALPLATEYVGSIEPQLLKRLLWWLAAAVSFFILTGVATGILSVFRRRRAAEGYPPHRGDQSAGVLLGAAKGALVASFLAAGMEKYSPDYIENGGWLGEQVKTSKALQLSRQYQPAERLWNSEPVQQFVGIVRRHGIEPANATRGLPDSPLEAIKDPIRTARRPKTLQVHPSASPSPVRSPEQEIEDALREIREELKKRP